MIQIVENRNEYNMWVVNTIVWVSRLLSGWLFGGGVCFQDVAWMKDLLWGATIELLCWWCWAFDIYNSESLLNDYLHVLLYIPLQKDKCIQIYKSILYYIINLVFLPHILAILVAILSEVHYKESSVPCNAPHWEGPQGWSKHVGGILWL